jgi:hypothetical protein
MIEIFRHYLEHDNVPIKMLRPARQLFGVQQPRLLRSR